MSESHIRLMDARLDAGSFDELLFAAGSHLLTRPNEDPAYDPATVYLQRMSHWVELWRELGTGASLAALPVGQAASDVEYSLTVLPGGSDIDPRRAQFLARAGINLAQDCIEAAYEELS